MKLIYSEGAVADLTRLGDFIATVDPQAAMRIAADLLSRVEALRQFPQMGRTVVQAPHAASVREFVFGRYVVRYSVHDAAVVILRIWHHHEDSGDGGKPFPSTSR